MDGGWMRLLSRREARVRAEEAFSMQLLSTRPTFVYTPHHAMTTESYDMMKLFGNVAILHFLSFLFTVLQQYRI